MPTAARLPFPADRSVTSDALLDLLDAHIEGDETGSWDRWRDATDRLGRPVATTELLRRCRDTIREGQ